MDAQGLEFLPLAIGEPTDSSHDRALTQVLTFTDAGPAQGSYFLFDVGLALEPLNETQRNEFLIGYNECLDFSDNFPEALESFFVLGLIECFSTLKSINVDTDWLNLFIKKNNDIYIKKYIENRNFLIK